MLLLTSTHFDLFIPVMPTNGRAVGVSRTACWGIATRTNPLI